MRYYVESSATNVLAYRLGGLLYMPAFQNNVVEKLETGSIPGLRSIAFCLEDAIRDLSLRQAEEALKNTLMELDEAKLSKNLLPLIFIRVRSPEHLAHVYKTFSRVRHLITGYILPKFDLSNAVRYLDTTRRLQKGSLSHIYVMPIMESASMVDASTRIPTLINLRSMLDEMRPHILNIRVGCNDFSQIYGLRCPIDKTVYDIGILKAALIDIISIFARDYVVAGPVWNYFGKQTERDWADGLVREMEQDLLHGFIGKSAIHPAQVPIIARTLAVSREDYKDACSLLEWKDDRLGVAKSVEGNRMNELKCHSKWAVKTKLLGDIYGLREAKLP